MVSIEAFSQLLQVLYSAPLQQEQWQRFLTRVCEHTGSNLGVFISADTRTGLSVLASGGRHGETATVLDYNRQFAQKDPFRPAVVRRCRSRNPVGVYSEADLVPTPEFLQSEIYQGLLGPANLRYAAITILACSVRKLDAISLWRTPEEGPADADSRRLLELLIPHVQTALEVRRVLGVTEQRLASAEAMANASQTATFVLTRRGVVEHWNTAAEALIRGGEGLALIDGHLCATDSEARAAFSKLLEDAALTPFAATGVSAQPFPFPFSSIGQAPAATDRHTAAGDAPAAFAG